MSYIFFKSLDLKFGKGPSDFTGLTLLSHPLSHRCAPSPPHPLPEHGIPDGLEPTSEKGKAPNTPGGGPGRDNGVQASRSHLFMSCSCSTMKPTRGMAQSRLHHCACWTTWASSFREQPFDSVTNVNLFTGYTSPSGLDQRGGLSRIYILTPYFFRYIDTLNGYFLVCDTIFVMQS